MLSKLSVRALGNLEALSGDIIESIDSSPTIKLIV